MELGLAAPEIRFAKGQGRAGRCFQSRCQCHCGL